MIFSDYIFDDQKFNDIDHFNQAIKEWNLQFRQLEKGLLKGSDIQFIKPGFLLGYAILDRHAEQAGSAPEGHFTFAFVVGSPIIWKGVEVGPDEVIVLKPGDEISGVGRSDFKILTLSIPEQVLERVCEEHELPATMKIIRGNELIRINQSEQSVFKSFLLEILRQIILNPSMINTPGFQMLCDKEIPAKLCQLVDGPVHNGKVFTSGKRESIIKNSMQFLSESSKDPVSLTDLCEVTGASERTLQYAFKEYFGISPKSYLKAYSLNNVHNALRRADPNKDKVVEIAYQFGFWHMGQFAADYKSMFGKLPSETLSS